MALPANYQTGTVTGKFVSLAGNPIVGSVSFAVSVDRLIDVAALTVIVPASITITLDADGAFTINLPATDDPDIAPTGFTYTVTENFIGGAVYSISVLQGTTLDLSSV